MLTKFHSVCHFLLEADSLTLSTVSFEEICHRFHADPVSVDRSFYSLFGMSGDEMMRQYRDGTTCL